MTNHKARKKLANQKWISEQAFGSRFADGLYRGFYDTSGSNAGYVSPETENFHWLKGDKSVITLTTADHDCVQMRFAACSSHGHH